MSIYKATAPGKVILFGEHAVVYGQPALAVPLLDLRATAIVESGAPGSGLAISAEDLNLQLSLAEAAAHALALTARLVLDQLAVPEPDARITVRSDIPIASGLGSGAAVSAALARALTGYLGQPLSDGDLSALVYEVEKFHHGTPSGIDNTVVCFEQPVYFVRGQAPEILRPGRPFELIVGDTGVASPTRETVSAVRKARERNRERLELIFAAIGSITDRARTAIEQGDIPYLGPLMNDNQALLRRLKVSSPELEALIAAALGAGAAGAKLSGGGGGGSMIALVEGNVDAVRNALYEAGATRVFHTVVR